ncbi:MAG: hypothetical protein JSS12_08305 [Verrucomicrobia bacterium]|nr:hypothetical protein [Verrucomicrobiota bacterium]
MRAFLCLALSRVTFLITLSATLSAAAVGSFDELTDAIQSGKQITIALDLERCMDKPGMPKGYFMPTALMHLPASETVQEHISTSHLQFTDQAGAATYEYVKYTIFKDGSVEVKVNFLDPKTFKSQAATHTVHCELGKGINVIVP